MSKRRSRRRHARHNPKVARVHATEAPSFPWLLVGATAVVGTGVGIVLGRTVLKSTAPGGYLLPSGQVMNGLPPPIPLSAPSRNVSVPAGPASAFTTSLQTARAATPTQLPNRDEFLSWPSNTRWIYLSPMDLGFSCEEWRMLDSAVQLEKIRLGYSASMLTFPADMPTRGPFDPTPEQLLQQSLNNFCTTHVEGQQQVAFQNFPGGNVPPQLVGLDCKSWSRLSYRDKVLRVYAAYAAYRNAEARNPVWSDKPRGALRNVYVGMSKAVVRSIDRFCGIPTYFPKDARFVTYPEFIDRSPEAMYRLNV